MKDKVLIIDDDEKYREILSGILIKYDVELHIAVNGAEAKTLIDDNKFSAIITDMSMPVSDGLNVLNHIRHKKGLKDIPIIIISGHAREYYGDALEGYNIMDIIGKPINIDRLKTHLDSMFTEV